MHPSKVSRARLASLTDLPNIGASLAEDLRMIGVERPEQLIGRNPVELYQQLCQVTGLRQDPCVLDTFMSITSFMNGEPARPWWEFTEQRKRMHPIQA